MSGGIMLLVLACLIAGVVLTAVGRRWLSTAMSLVAAIALWLMLFPPQVDRASEKVISLRTDGAVGPATGYQLQDRVTGDRQVADLGALLRQEPELATLQLRGFGLPAAAWQAYPELVPIFQPAPLPPGLIVINPEPRLTPGEALVLRGHVIPAVDPGWRVRLLGSGGTELASSAVESGAFSLQYVPRIEGAQVYRIEALDIRGQSRFEEPVPVYVRPTPVLRARIVLARPSFEANAIRRWLEHHGAELQLHSRLSRGVIRSDGVGLDPGSPAEVLENLETLDLLLIDAATLVSWSEGDFELLESAIRDGLGLLVLGDSELLELKELWGIRFVERSGERVADAVTLAEGDLIVHRHPVGLNTGVAGSPIKAANGETLLATSHVGRGAVGISIATDTHAWVTSGQANRHADFWAGIVSKLARSQTRASWLQPGTDLPSVGEVVEHCRTDASAGESCVRHYPERSGWFRADDTVAPVYVFAADDWPTARAKQRISASQRASQGTQVSKPIVNSEPVIDPFALFIALLVLLGALWLVQKLAPEASDSSHMHPL
jgi:hypothetical protein